MPGAVLLDRCARQCASTGLDFRDIEAELLAGGLVLRWHGRACLSAPSAIEKASAKASLYA
jgi:hypothetical protein